jgi:hypothetical protein
VSHKKMIEVLTTSGGDEFFDRERAHASEHLIKLDERWSLWRCVAIRGAGFPVGLVLNLAAPSAAAAADRILESERGVAAARVAAVAALERELTEVATVKRAALIKIIKHIKNDRLPVLDDEGEESETALTLKALEVAWNAHESAKSEFDQHFEQDSLRISEVIREIASAKDYREAVTWQNRHALHGSIAGLLGMPPGQPVRTRDQRRREETVANYLQRYCTKNDTIGFFGPLGWAEFLPDGDNIAAQPGATLLAERNVYFEVWCIDELAGVLSQDKRLRPWIAPRRASYLDLVGTTLYLPSRSSLNLPIREAATLRACDGHQTAKEIAANLIHNPLTGIRSEEEVYALLASFEQRGLIVWKLEVPIELYPERTLRRCLERVDDEGLRRTALAALGEVESARRLIEDAVGDAEELDHAIGNLETVFTRLTGTASTRSAGQMYAGRTLVYEDCRRDLAVGIGPEVRTALAAPLSLLLTSARWFTCEIADLTRRLFDKVYAETTRRTHSRVVDFTTLWYQLYPLIFTAQKQPVDTLLPALQKRWAEILSIPAGARRVEYTSDELRARVEAAFDAPKPKWKSAIYHSPDILIAAESVAAIQRGDYQFVLGEMHVTINTMRGAVFVAQHPEPADLFRSYASDHPEPCAVSLIPKSHWPAKSSRMLPILVSPKDFRIEFSPEPSDVPPSQVIPFGALVVEDCGKGVVVRTRDGRLHFDPLDILSITPPLSVGNDFKILSSDSHTPRVTFDRLVVSRETWFFPPAELEFVREKDEAKRFVAARGWARTHGIPRFAFMKSPVEVKPMFVDFDSPTYVNILTTVVRRTQKETSASAQLAFSEMLPTPDHAWLPDALGQRYTSELRMVVVDAGN